MAKNDKRWVDDLENEDLREQTLLEQLEEPMRVQQGQATSFDLYESRSSDGRPHLLGLY